MDGKWEIRIFMVFFFFFFFNIYVWLQEDTCRHDLNPLILLKYMNEKVLY